MQLGLKLAYTAVAVAAIIAGGIWVSSDAPKPQQNVAPLSIDTDLFTGDMRKLTMLDAPIPVPDIPFEDASGNVKTIQDWRGSVVVLNFWATWCAPCRHEMPQLAQLQREMGSEDLVVMPLVSGPSQTGTIERFLDDINASDLPYYRSPNSRLAQKMGISALPVTVLVDRSGAEVARLIGDADWSSDAAKSILRTLMAQ